jgi:hypothetical protein
MPTTALYAAILSLIFVALSLRTIRMRRRQKIAIGYADNDLMLRAMRVHANFAEYVPLSLILIYLVEISGRSTWLVHCLGLCLIVGRLLHAYGVSQPKEVFKFRITGMVLTLTTILACSATLLQLYIRRSFL